MPMDRNSALAQLTALTAGLSPTAGTSAEELQTARMALARSLLLNEAPVAGTDALPVAPVHAPSSAQLADLGRVVDEAAGRPTEPAPLATLRNLPATLLGNASLTPTATNGLRPQSIGPFVDQIGVLHWIDLFPPLQQTAITRAGGTSPFLVLPVAVAAGPVPTTVPIGGGSLWISAQLLAPGAPAGAYAGFAISGGSLTFSQVGTDSAVGIQVPSTCTLTLTVTPGGSPGPVGGGNPGADGGAVVAELPNQVTFVVTQTAATITASGSASLTVYGATVAMKWLSGPPVYEPALAQILVPFQPQSANFAVASVQSTLFVPSGQTRIGWAAWALPVAVTPAAQLGAAANGGALALALDAGLRASRLGGVGAAQIGGLFLEGAPGVLSLLAAVGAANQFGGNVDLWANAPPSTGRSSVNVIVPKGAVLYYTSVAAYAGTSHVEILTCGATVATQIDRPVTADGARLGISFPGTLAIYRAATGDGAIISGQAPAASSSPAISLALRNALLITTPPTLILVSGRFTASPAELDSGWLLLAFGIESLLPTLPDPYAANFLPVARTGPAQASSLLLAEVSWSTASGPRLNFFDTALPTAVLQVQPLAASQAPPQTGVAAVEDEQRQGELMALFNRSLDDQSPDLFLLDVSGNVDQFGVAMASAPSDFVETDTGLVIAGLDLGAPSSILRVFTMPAVQWEPVSTIQNSKVLPSPFPSPTGFLDDGGPTLLGVNDVTMVPVAPASLLNQVVSGYANGKAGAALFTLPFGMRALATLPASASSTSRPGLTTVQPTFATNAMTGGNQISLTAAPGFFRADPGLPGAAVQLRNLVDQNGNPVVDPRTTPPFDGLQLSVLGPDVDQMFNTTFAPGAASALAPINRVDFSGYGASSFSDWTDPAADPPAVVQVHFNMMVGRTAREVVQVKSTLYSVIKVTVVRTITIDRQDDTEVYRHDSGWVATTPGTVEIPGITSHPGVVTGALNIRNILDTSQGYSSGAVEMVGVYYDADVQIEGVTSGAIQGLVPCTRMFGYVQTAPIGTPLTASEFAALIASQGAVGGQIDCVISIGGTAQTMRLLRIEISNAPHPGATETHEFAVAARGSLVLPRPGNWSVLARTDNVSEPTAIDPDLGASLIRQGAAGAAASTAPWRLAEPVDLWTPDSPSMDFCLLHSTDSTRVLFPRPQIANGANAITSDQTPLLADGFALMGATSICPRQDSCLRFPNANYALEISGVGALTLAGAPTTFPPSVSNRVLSTGSAGTIGFEYADESGKQAEVSVAITPAAWSVELHGVNVRLDVTPFDGLMRIVGDVDASIGSGVALQGGRIIFGSILQPLQDLLSFLEKLGVPNPLAISFSNTGWTKSYKLQAGISFSLPNNTLLPLLTPFMTQKTADPPGLMPFRAQIALKTSFGNTVSGPASGPFNSSASPGDLLATSSMWSFVFTISGSAQWEVVSPLPAKAGFLVAYSIQLVFPAGRSPQREQLIFQLGGIITVGGNIIPKVVAASYSVSIAFQLVVTTEGPGSITLGAMLIISGSCKILDGLIGIALTAEAAGLFVTSPKELQATFSISLDVSLCWCLDVSFDAAAQYTWSLS